MKNWSSWYKLVFLQSFFLALYSSKTTPDSDELPYTSSFSKSPSSHHTMFSLALCHSTSTLHPSGSLNEISLENFMADNFLGFFSPRDEKKQGQSRYSLQMSKNKSKSCFGHVEFSWPSHEGCKIRGVFPGVFDCRAGWDLAELTLSHMHLQPVPVPAYKICCKIFVCRKKLSMCMLF